MTKTPFLKTGHTPTLFAAFLYFDISFMVWVMLGPLGVQIAHDLGLTAAQKGLMVATPVLAGALLRIVMGVLVDRVKPKMAGPARSAAARKTRALPGQDSCPQTARINFSDPVLGWCMKFHCAPQQGAARYPVWAKPSE